MLQNNRWISGLERNRKTRITTSEAKYKWLLTSVNNVTRKSLIAWPFIRSFINVIQKITNRFLLNCIIIINLHCITNYIVMINLPHFSKSQWSNFLRHVAYNEVTRPQYFHYEFLTSNFTRNGDNTNQRFFCLALFLDYKEIRSRPFCLAMVKNNFKTEKNNCAYNCSSLDNCIWFCLFRGQYL